MFPSPDRGNAAQSAPPSRTLAGKYRTLLTDPAARERVQGKAFGMLVKPYFIVLYFI